MPPTTGPITSSLRPLVQIEEHYHKLEVLNLEQLQQLLRQQLLQLLLLPRTGSPMTMIHLQLFQQLLELDLPVQS